MDFLALEKRKYI